MRKIKNILIYFLDLAQKVALKEKSPHKLALSCSTGIYIAFSPFIGLHTAMIFVFSWLFRLNPTITFSACYLNNPWTALFFILSAYFFGFWMMHDLFKVNLIDSNPLWMNYINSYLGAKIGVSNICFWSFFVGGNVLGILIGLLIYPISKWFFTKIINNVKNISINPLIKRTKNKLEPDVASLD